MTTDWGAILPCYPEITGIHPAADLFPMVDGDELAALCADIQERGLQQPIIVWRDGTLLDGRNRLVACYRTNQEVVLETCESDDPVQFSLSANLHRRHLNQGQKAMVALKVEEIFEADARDRKAEAGRSAAPGRPAKKDEANLPHVISKPATSVASPLPAVRAPQARDQAAAVVGASGR